MTDTNAQEPTMEEILASIRRIISEDDAPAAAPADVAEAVEAAPAPAPVAEAVTTPTFEEGDDDDILELTQPEPPLERAPPSAPAAETLGDIEASPRFTPEPAPAAAPPPLSAFAPAPYEPDEDVDGLISPPAADLAASAFGQLSRTLGMPAEGRTLEDVVRELLRPLLKDWLDRNLSSIVEAAVQAEVDRISRLRRF